MKEVWVTVPDERKINNMTTECNTWSSAVSCTQGKKYKKNIIGTIDENWNIDHKLDKTIRLILHFLNLISILWFI